MGLLKKLGIIVLIYAVAGVVLSAMMHFGYLPTPGGLEGSLNLLYIIFQPITLVYFMIVMGLGLHA
jgi:hypothetical protein